MQKEGKKIVGSFITVNYNIHFIIIVWNKPATSPMYACSSNMLRNEKPGNTLVRIVCSARLHVL